MSYNGTPSSNANGRSIPSVGTGSRRSVPTPRSSTSALERKLEEALKGLEQANKSLEEHKMLIDNLTNANEEIKTRLNNKPTDEVNEGFPGSKKELEQIRLVVLEEQEKQLKGATWNLEETLIKSPENGFHVVQIIKNTLANTRFQYITSNYVWPTNNAIKYMKYVLWRQYCSQKQSEKNKTLSMEQQDQQKKKNNWQTRKSHLLSRRRTAYNEFKEELANVFGTHEECQQVLTSEMLSDQEDEYDEEGTLLRAKKVPHYRKQQCTDFFYKLDELRTANNRRMNNSFVPTRVGSRVVKVVHARNPKKLRKLPAWAIDHTLV